MTAQYAILHTGYVGEETNKRLLYLVAVSRKLEDPLSAIVLSQSGAGKSGLTEVIERLCPPEDVVLLTRLTPQSLYYTEPGFLDHHDHAALWTPAGLAMIGAALADAVERWGTA